MPAVEEVGALGWAIEQAENREEGGLAASRRSGHGDVFALVDVQVDAGEGVGFDFVGQEDLGNAVEFD